MALACIVATQRRLDEIHNKTNLRRPVGALSAILSNENQGTARAKFLNDDGKTKKYNITYIGRNCNTPVDCSSADLCASGTAAPSLTTTEQTVTKCKSLPVFSCTHSQFRDLCNWSSNQYFVGLVQGQMDTLIRQVNSDILTKMCANIGCFDETTATTEKALTLLDSTTGAPKWNVDWDIREQFINNGISETPLLIGNAVTMKFANGYNNGGISAAGVNFDGMVKFPAYYDNQLQTICAPSSNSTMLAIAPGVVHFFNYLNNAGDFQSNIDTNSPSFDPTMMMREGSTFAHGVIMDNNTGLMFDMDVEYVSCEKKWKFKISLNYDTWVMPVVTCTSNTAGTAACFTGVQKFRVV